MTIYVDELRIIARQIRIGEGDTTAGRDIDELAWWLKGALGWEMEGAARYRLKVRRSSSPHRESVSLE